MYLNAYVPKLASEGGIAFEAIDNGLLSCADLPVAQRLSEGLSPAEIDAFFRKWLARLPHRTAPRTAKPVTVTMCRSS